MVSVSQHDVEKTLHNFLAVPFDQKNEEYSEDQPCAALRQGKYFFIIILS